MLSDRTYRYAYDNEGNLVTKTKLSTNEVSTFSYDHRNRMTRVEQRNAAGALVSHVNFSYDALDRRIVVDSNGSKTTTVYVGDAPWADFDGEARLTARYLPGERTDELLARYRPSDGVTWYLGDRQGSVRDLMNSSGAIIDHLDYGSFGNVRSETNAAAGDRFKYTGRELDPVSGLYYYRARFYDPTTGKFVNEDPKSFEAGDANLRRYVGNDPINATDPSGNQAISEADGLAAFVSVYANYALTYGADVPFTYRVGCKPGSCGITGNVDGYSSSLGGVPIPKSKNLYSAGGAISNNNWSGSVVVTAGWFSGSVSVDKKGKVTESVGLAGPFSPTFGSDTADIPDIPSFPDDGEFNLLVKSTATSPHLVISGDGVQDALEPGVGSVVVKLFTPGADGVLGGGDDVMIGSVRTDAFGYYLFASLQPGLYYVQFDVSTIPSGFIPTKLNVGSDDRDSDADSLGFDSVTSLEAGEVDLTHDMGIKPRE